MTSAPTTVTGLANGTAYRFSVKATNTVGDSAASAASNEVTPKAPATAPGAPTSVTATGGDKQAQVSWTAPANDGGSPITGYTVTSTPGGITKTVTGDQRTTTVTGLANGTAYRFTVKATNTVGDSPASNPSNEVVPATTPDQMAKPVVTVRGSKATVVWKPAADNGSAITQYTVLVSGERPETVDPSKNKLVVRGLAKGRHKVKVYATNALGDSDVSEATKIRVG